MNEEMRDKMANANSDSSVLQQLHLPQQAAERQELCVHGYCSTSGISLFRRSKRYAITKELETNHYQIKNFI